MTATADVIDVRGLVKRYGGRAVVDNVSLTVARGEIAGFLGPNGSGKTTSIRLMCGLLDPDAGTGTVLGHDIRRARRRIKAEVGYMTQKFSLYEDLTVAENLAFVAGLHRLPDQAGRVRDTLADLGLTHRRGQLAGTLSGGWKQRLALAAALMHDPALLMLDEPTAGVDPRARRDFWDELHARAADGLTVLVSTHYMDEAERCHRINFISHGRLIASGTVDAVIAESGLHTFELNGGRIAEAERRLKGLPGVDEVSAFGVALHAVGRDQVALHAAVEDTAREFGATAQEIDVSLEDVFIAAMSAPAADGGGDP